MGKQRRCVCGDMEEGGGQCEVRCWERSEVGWEFDGLRRHLPLCDLRRRGC